MDSNTKDVVEALTMAMESYVGLISNAIYNFFKFTFCTYNTDGQITGLNFMGSIVILFLGITILGVLIKYLFEALTPWHHEEEFIKEEDDITNKVEEVLPPIEKEEYKPKKKIDYIVEEKQRIEEIAELEKLKAERRARKALKNK